MTAIYKMEQNPPKKGSGKKVVLHPRIVPWDTVSTDRLIEEASSRSTYTSGDLKGAVRLLSDMLKEKLRDGYNVYLDGIGYFSVSLKSRPVEDKKELRSESVHFKNVNFRCCAGLKHELKTMPVERYKEPKVTDFSQEEKESRLLRYLERHAYITTLAYQGLNGLYPISGTQRSQTICGRWHPGGRRDAKNVHLCEASGTDGITG